MLVIVLGAKKGDSTDEFSLSHRSKLRVLPQQNGNENESRQIWTEAEAR